MNKEVKRLQDYLDACKTKEDKECDGIQFLSTKGQSTLQKVEPQLLDPNYFLEQMEQNRGRCDYGLQETLRLGIGKIFFMRNFICSLSTYFIFFCFFTQVY